MDAVPGTFLPDGFDGGRDFINLTAEVDGHTYIYSYPVEEAEDAVSVIYSHAQQGRLPPCAAMILVELAGEDL